MVLWKGNFSLSHMGSHPKLYVYIHTQHIHTHMYVLFFMHESITRNLDFKKLNLDLKKRFTFWKWKCKNKMCLTIFLHYFCNIKKILLRKHLIVILNVYNLKYFNILTFNKPTCFFQVPSAFSCSFWRLRNFSSFSLTFSLCSSLSLSRVCNKINYPKNNQYHINEFWCVLCCLDLCF